MVFCGVGADFYNIGKGVLNIPDEIPSAVRRYGNHFLASLLCIPKYNFYGNISKAATHRRCGRALTNIPIEMDSNQAQNRRFPSAGTPISKFPDLRFRATRIFSVQYSTNNRWYSHSDVCYSFYIMSISLSKYIRRRKRAKDVL